MTDRPILFTGPMVRALLAGTKTQTRRIVKPDIADLISRGVDSWQANDGTWWFEHDNGSEYPITDLCPYGQPGDRLWVREKWKPTGLLCGAKPRDTKACGHFAYAADDQQRERDRFIRWRPCIHMPRWASRITLEVTEVRVQRLNEISEEDAIAEGGPPSHRSIDIVSRSLGYVDFPRSWFAQLWESINGPGSWDLNPWVWAITFRKVKL